MTLPVSNDLSFNAINTELGRTATSQLSINDSELRELFGQASGAVDINTGHGKSSLVPYVTGTTGQVSSAWTQIRAYGWGTGRELYSTNDASYPQYAAGTYGTKSKPTGNQVRVGSNSVYIHGVSMYDDNTNVDYEFYYFTVCYAPWPGPLGNAASLEWFDTVTFSSGAESLTFSYRDIYGEVAYDSYRDVTFWHSAPQGYTSPLATQYPTITGYSSPGTAFTVTFTPATGLILSGGNQVLSDGPNGANWYANGTSNIAGGSWINASGHASEYEFALDINSFQATVWDAFDQNGQGISPWGFNYVSMANGIKISAPYGTPGNYSKIASYFIRKIGTVSILATGYFQMP